MLTTPVSERSAWKGSDLSDPRTWARELSAQTISELDDALKRVRRRAIRLEDLTKTDFPLVHFKGELASISEELHEGRGFTVLRGFPVDRYSDDDAATIYYGIGTHLGMPCPQSAAGDVLGHVRDQGHADYRGTENPRGYQTRGGLPYHTDHIDLVGLLCLRPAKEGGLSSIVSSVTMHNELLAHHREYLGLLYKDYFYHFRGEQAAGHANVYRSPLYKYEAGTLTCRTANVDYIYQAQDTTGIPLCAVELEALELFQRLASDPSLRLDMDLQPGDMQFLHNSVVLHSRTSYVDYEEAERKRHLLRLWLDVPAARRHRGSAWHTARETPQPAGTAVR